MTTVPRTTARPLPYIHDMLPPGIAQQVQAEHDALVGSLEALLAESRADADRITDVAARNAHQVDAYLAELRAARRVVTAARDLVAIWEASGHAAVVTRVLGPAGHLVHTVRDSR
ncbi:hypothetical protein DBB34_03365 [Sphaerisporangium cinnabarinum]|nr:hypothetical protein [Sphaerisporangium cinnabarinum]PTU57585.1 hypothetical protein DBB34_03365 [Sphaerisporangium cinnabarinum]